MPLPIENSRFALAFQCPLRWENLRPTEDEGVRFCEACLKPVYRCDTPEELAYRAKTGDCAAAFVGDERRFSSTLGAFIVEPVSEPDPGPDPDSGRAAEEA